MKTRIACCAALFAVLSMPAMAQVPPYQAEIDCGGLVTPPASVPFTLRLENQTLQTIPIDVTVQVRLPAGQSFTIRQATINLRPNQDKVINQSFGLPANAPPGSYTMTFTATSASFSTFDTCSFNAN